MSHDLSTFISHLRVHDLSILYVFTLEYFISYLGVLGSGQSVLLGPPPLQSDPGQVEKVKNTQIYLMIFNLGTP